FGGRPGSERRRPGTTPAAGQRSARSGLRDPPDHITEPARQPVTQGEPLRRHRIAGLRVVHGSLERRPAGSQPAGQRKGERRHRQVPYVPVALVCYPGEIRAAAQVVVCLTEPALDGGDTAERSKRLDQGDPVAAFFGLLEHDLGEGAVAPQVARAVPDPAQLIERKKGQVIVLPGGEQFLGPLTRRCRLGGWPAPIARKLARRNWTIPSRSRSPEAARCRSIRRMTA